MNLYAFILTSLAGVATLLGFFIIENRKEKNIIPKSLGFSAGILLAVSLLDLLPSSFQYFKQYFLSGFDILFCFLFFFLGIFFSILIEEGIEKKIGDKNNLYRVGLLSLLAILLHNIPEGIITYLMTTIEFHSGFFLACSIACHNIPEGICIAIPIYYSTHNKKKTFFYLLVAALSEPMGAFIACLFLQKNLSFLMIGMLLSSIAGIMVSLATTEILPEAKSYSLKYAISSLVIGILFFLVAHLLFG